MRKLNTILILLYLCNIGVAQASVEFIVKGISEKAGGYVGVRGNVEPLSREKSLGIGVIPDVEVKPTIADIHNSIDTEMEAVIKMIR